MYSKIYLLLIMSLLLTPRAMPQEKTLDSRQWVSIDSGLMYNIVIATDKNLNVTKGLLYGMKGDSIYLNIRNQMISLNLKNLISLSVEDNRTNNKATVYGALSGMYLGSLLFLTSAQVPAYYLDYSGGLLFALYEVTFGTAGGAIGYLAGLSSKDNQVVFYFDKDEENFNKDINKLETFLMNKDKQGKIKLNIHMSQVRSRLSEIQNNSGYFYQDNYYDLHNFNLLRKISLTYEMFEKLELGVAVAWFSEPSLSTFSYNYFYYGSSISQTFNGTGYYIITNYKPLKDYLPEYFDFLVGCGIGMAKIDFNFTSESTTYVNDVAVNDTSNTKINKFLFSALLTSEMKYYLYPGLDLSLQADYSYINGNMPAIPVLGLSARNLGGFTFGIGLGFNF